MSGEIDQHRIAGLRDASDVLHGIDHRRPGRLLVEQRERLDIGIGIGLGGRYRPRESGRIGDSEVQRCDLTSIFVHTNGQHIQLWAAFRRLGDELQNDRVAVDGDAVTPTSTKDQCRPIAGQWNDSLDGELGFHPRWQ